MSRLIDTRGLQFGIGTSDLDDPAEAGRAAGAAAVAGLAGRQAALVIAYVSVRYDLAAALGGINDATGAAPLVGATSSGHFEGGRLTEPGRGLTVLALAGGDYRFGVASVTGLRTGAFAAGRTLARAAQEAAGPQRAPHEALIILSDGLAGDQQELINGVYRVTGVGVPVVGGAAGDDRLLSETSVFFGDKVLNDAAVAVWIGSPKPISVVCGHGWQPSGLPLLVTKVDGTVVREIGGRPALTVFAEQFPEGWPRRPDGENAAYEHAQAFGLIEPDGSLLIRGVFVDDENQLRTFAPLPAYAAVQAVSCSRDGLLGVSGETITRALDRPDARVVLVFSCVARLDILAERGAEEAARMQDAAGEIPTFGFYTYGEFARTTSVAGYHNASIAAVAL